MQSRKGIQFLHAHHLQGRRLTWREIKSHKLCYGPRLFAATQSRVDQSTKLTRSMKWPTRNEVFGCADLPLAVERLPKILGWALVSKQHDVILGRLENACSHRCKPEE